MSNLTSEVKDRRSTRSLFSRNLDESDKESQTKENKLSEKSDENGVDEFNMDASVEGPGAGRIDHTSKDVKGKQESKQNENIPDNTQIIPDDLVSNDMTPNPKGKMDKKAYKKKQIKPGITDREWLSAKEHIDKWTALGGKRGMCNDCKKVFSSRQVQINIKRHKVEVFNPNKVALLE